MIEVISSNSKGERTTAYTHINYLSDEYKQNMSNWQHRWQKLANTTLFATTLGVYVMSSKVPVLNNLIQSKINIPARYLFFSSLVGLSGSLLVSAVSGGLKNGHSMDLLRRESYPIWFSRENVVNPSRVYYDLDDFNNNELNIVHSGLSVSGAAKLYPDAIVGSMEKPQPPVAEGHHHH